MVEGAERWRYYGYVGLGAVLLNFGIGISNQIRSRTMESKSSLEEQVSIVDALGSGIGGATILSGAMLMTAGIYNLAKLYKKET